MIKKQLYKKVLIPLAKIYWSILKPKTFGVKAIILCDNEVLLVKNVSESKWHLSGGGVHKNESNLEAIKREVKEELNLDLDSLLINKIYTNDENFKTKFSEDNLLHTYVLLGTYVSDYEGKQDTIYVYVFTLSSKLKLEIDKNELSDARWFDINYLLSNNEHDNDKSNSNKINSEISPATLRRIKEYFSGQQYTGKSQIW